MFEQLFMRSPTLARPRAGPLVQERLAYLSHRASQGSTLTSLRTIAQYLLVIAHYLRLADRPGESISGAEIERQAVRWANRRSTRSHRRPGRLSAANFRRQANRWLQFLGRLEPRSAPVNPNVALIADFADYLHRDRGLSPKTISNRCWLVRRFLDQLGIGADSLREITITRIDEAFQEMLSPRGYARLSVRTWASDLRAFVRYAEMRGWCRPGLAQAMQSPRVFSQASLPSGPSWDDVRRLLATSEGDRPIDIRDRAILMLLAVYGLRASAVRLLRLEDFDWQQELLLVTCPKTGQARTYPLCRPVGDAVLRYLKEVRPRSMPRTVFLSLRSPIRRLGKLWFIVTPRLGRVQQFFRRTDLQSVLFSDGLQIRPPKLFLDNSLRSLGVSLAHYGTHTLRHACACQLLAQGLSLKEIGDHLGHRNPASTRTYVKVDLAGLRQVAEFDLGGLS